MDWCFKRWFEWCWFDSGGVNTWKFCVFVVIGIISCNQYINVLLANPYPYSFLLYLLIISHLFGCGPPTLRRHISTIDPSPTNKITTINHKTKTLKHETVTWLDLINPEQWERQHPPRHYQTIRIQLQI